LCGAPTYLNAVMKRDVLQKFQQARQRLEVERNNIQSRLAEIDRVLSNGALPTSPAARTNGRRGRRGQGSNLSMREAAQQVLKSGPKDMHQLIDGIQRLGYQFASKKPRNSLAVLLYTNKKIFKAKRGMFSLK
jgi:hypothetical protein